PIRAGRSRGAPAEPSPFDTIYPSSASGSAPDFSDSVPPLEAGAGDEGVAPLRFPSIEAAGALTPGAAVAFIVDLRREEVESTFGGVALPTQPADWTSLALDVLLTSPQVEFDAGGAGAGVGAGRLTVHRNADSTPARIRGRLRADLARGAEIEVKARFVLGTRYCGSAARRFIVGAGAAPAAADGAAAAAVQLDASAAAPDLTVFITLFDQTAPGRLHWRLVTPPFASLPPRLDGLIDLGRDPAAEATALFRQFAKLERGQHREAIDGFGEQLWQRAPAVFRDAYWALHDHYQRPLTIQFVSDDPHLPWELMSPYRDGEAHGPLALRHPVARWIGQWQGYMRNRLPTGKLFAVAPHYRSASTQLSLAEAAAQALVDGLGAQRWGATREQMLALLEHPPTDETVALLYFTGHGAFAADVADASLIKLEDGANLSSREVARQKVTLGERDGTVVFLNACEVGASGSVLGNVGGWADAFLSRRFGAFIAPLWAIDEEDAAQVTEDLMARIVTRGEPLGAALRDLRAAHGAVSPTFYSYLLYGDVTARLGRT
ncbi:MAG: CHAT domain-containing protein, partial [Rubrivivax sp.]